VLPASEVSDQPFWGDVLRRRGAAVASRRAAGAVDAAGFARLLSAALADLPGLAAAARALAEEMRRAPDGLGVAVGALRGELLRGGARAPARAPA
jgi:hypothetical protein